MPVRAPARPPAAAALLAQWADAGYCLGGQLFVWQDGKTVADLAVGASGPDRAAATADVSRLYCAIKPVIACALARAGAAGEVCFDDPASRFLPAMPDAARRAITLRQLLSHSSGLPNFLPGELYDQDFDTRVKIACTQPLGARWWYGQPTYNNTQAWHMLAGVVEKVYGARLTEVVARFVAGPTGLPALTMSHPDPARYVRCYLARPEFPELPEPPAEVQFSQVNPAHGGFGSARDLGLFYAALVRAAAGDDTALLGSAVVGEMIRPHAVIALLPTFEQRAYGLGFFSGARDPLTGGNWSETSFGHPGHIGRHRVIHGFADIRHRVAVAVRLFSVGAKNNWMFRRIAAAVWSDLGLDHGPGPS
jgi:CubicO group peptidase (beta-lactamase class C family)